MDRKSETVSLAARIMGMLGGGQGTQRQMEVRLKWQKAGAAARRGQFTSRHKHRSRSAGDDRCACGARRVGRGLWNEQALVGRHA